MSDKRSLSFLSRSSRSRSFVIGGIMTLFLLICAVISLFWTPGSAYNIVIANRFLPPSGDHWLGTDQFGRDIASMLMTGTQNSIVVAVVAVSIGLFIGVSLGLLAAARRGWTEEIIMRLSDFSFAFPAILSAIMLTAILGPGGVNSILAIGLYNIPVFARLTRGSAMAARASGKGRFRITFEHILPNILSIIIVQATILFAIAILAEAALSYLGLGTQPPEPSWGRMLNEAQTLMFLDPMQAIYPGLAIAIAVFGLNLLGDGLRDVLDPRLSRKR